MSYNTQTITIAKADGDPSPALLDEADRLLVDLGRYDGQPVDAIRDHLAAAVEAGVALAKAVGRPDDTLAVAIAGHANPDHAPAEGYADETITVTVRVVRQ